MFTPVPTRIEDILNAPSQFAIPVYQREYKWGEDEAVELIEDLRNYPDSDGENLFLGNLIFEKTSEQKTYVVDGQQRLTTVILLLVACRMHAKNLGLSALMAAIQDKITFIDATTAESVGCRLIASDSNLLVIYFKTNSKLGNASPAKKIERLQGDLSKDVQNLPYITEFVRKYGQAASSWDKKQILERAADMAQHAYRVVWKMK